MKRSYLVAAVSIVTLFANPVFAEHADTSTDKPSETSSTARPEAKSDLPEKQIDLLAEIFVLPKELVKERYGKSIPEAIEKARPKKAGGQEDESEIAKLMAELIGTRTNELVEKTIMPKVEAEMKKEAEKDGADKNRYLDLLKRLFWAGKVVAGEDSPKPEAQAFNKAFREEIKKNQESRKELEGKIKDALEGNKTAKEFLREKVNRASVMSFMDGQRKNGNEKGAADLAKALSWNDNGKPTLYVKDKAGAIQSLPIGNTPAETSKALKDFGEKNKGWENYSLSLYPPAPQPPPVPLATPGATASTAATGAGAATGGATGGAAAAGAPTSAAVTATINSACMKCHGSLAPTLTVSGEGKDMKVSVGGTQKTLSEISGALEGNAAMRSVPDAVKAQFKTWASAQ